MFTVRLAPGKEARLQAGHPWIYRSEIARVEDEGEPGAIAEVQDSRGRFLGQAMVNLKSQIAGRLLSRVEEPIDATFFGRRIGQAVARCGRSAKGPDACRLVFGEADHLPGLIVDRYGDLQVIQILTAGMERVREMILAALRAAIQPRAIYERNDVSPRKLEGLELRKGFAWGQGETGLCIQEGDLRFFVEVAEGQKTGFFLDQRENRRVVKGLAAGREVLDCFCYSGGFALSAAAGGAAAVTGIDLSAEAIAWAEQSAELNSLSSRCTFMIGNAFDALRAFDREGRRFGMLILDPPAFTKGKGALAGALRGYKEINLRAMKLLAPGGILVSCSCSYHVDAPTFLDMLRAAAADAHREFQLRELRTQANDHPILLAARETQYLKCAILEALD
ncbi:MAG: class I SAM-dependent rRNA methyltransferase [candidate division NC10 bacterium]|nr:class I SAM-dependent rRNA methyltransferase [candidate division NC10 bacterium]MBI2455867.1 class I SAM-dependent rRNA methyltransferase [candidate division NC10 bacterium]